MPPDRPDLRFDLPLFLTANRLRIVVVGGGPVGRRKAGTLVSAGATVRVVALEGRPAELPSDPRLEWLTEPYRPDHLDGAGLVFAAGPVSVNERVAADARARGLFVCRTDEAGLGDFTTPVTVRRGRFTIAVSTGGASPSLARRIRDRLGETFDETFADWVGVLGRWRDRALQADWKAPEGRDGFLERISEWSWLELFRAEGADAVEAEYWKLAGELGLRAFPV
jgi:precorrin-2 dehydrogenase